MEEPRSEVDGECVVDTGVEIKTDFVVDKGEEVEKRGVSQQHAWFPELGSSASPDGLPRLLECSPLHTLLTNYSPDKILNSTVPCNDGIGRKIVYPAMLIVTRKPMRYCLSPLTLALLCYVLSCTSHFMM